MTSTAAASRLTDRFDETPLAAYARSLYPVGFALALFPLSDIGARLIPSDFDNLQWRFGAIGLSMSSLSVLVAGAVILGITAAMRENRVLLRIIAVFSLLLALLLLGALAVFSLDTLQLRGMLRSPAGRPPLMKMALSAAAAGGLHFLAFLGVSAACFRGARRSAALARLKGAPAAPGLVYKVD